MSDLTPYGQGVTARLRDSAELFAQRAAVYKDNYKAVGRVMEALFPDGHTQSSQDDHNRWHLFELVIVKLTRYAQNYDTGGHLDSLDDMIVYLAMLAQLDVEAEEDDPEELFEPDDQPVASGGVLDQDRADAEGWHLQPVVLRTADNTLISAEYGPDRTLFKVGNLMRFKQHQGRGKTVRITALDPNREDGMTVEIQSTDGNEGDWVHPAWLHRA